MAGHVKDLRKRKQGYKGDYPFWARAYDPEGKEYSETFATEDEADVWLARQLVAQAEGRWVDPREGLVTFRTYAEAWRRSAMHAPSTTVQVESVFRNHLYGRIGDRELASIRQGDIQKLIKQISAKLAPATVETTYNHLASVFLHAVANRVIVDTPCQKIGLPRNDKPEIEPLSWEEIEALADFFVPRYRGLLWLGAGTGLRQGELLGLTLDRINFRRSIVTVDRQMITPAGFTDEQREEIDELLRNGMDIPRGLTRPHFGPTKTAKSNRKVPLPSSVTVRLQNHLEEFPPPTTGEFAGLIFTLPDGSPPRRQRISEAWTAAARAAGVSETFHALRHFYASLLIRAGESVVTVQKRLGHASATETLDTYSHLWPDAQEKTCAAVDDVFSPRLRTVATA